MHPQFRNALAMAATLLSQSSLAVEYNQVQSVKVSFTSKQMNVPVEGGFKTATAQISFDPAKPAAAKAQVDVDMASIDAGSKEADDEVKGRNWLAVGANPKASFVATSVKPLGGNRFEASGKLSIKGLSRDVTAPFTLTPNAGGAVFEGGFVLKRADFGIGQGVWADFETVANEIQIRFKLSAAAKK